MFVWINEWEGKEFFDSAENNKSWACKAFTEVYFVDIDEIEEYFNECGIQKVTIFEQEGITATKLMDLEKAPEDIRNY